MPKQAITQEALLLPLLRFMARRGGAVGRQDDDVLLALAWELNLSREESQRVTPRGRWQWKATVEYCRQKLIENWQALEPEGPPGVWRLTRAGRKYAADPPEYMIKHWNRWCGNRLRELRGHEPVDVHTNGARNGRRNGTHVSIHNGARPRSRKR